MGPDRTTMYNRNGYLRSRSSTAVFLIAVGGLIAGCGGSGASPSTSTSPPPSDVQTESTTSSTSEAPPATTEIATTVVTTTTAAPEDFSEAYEPKVLHTFSTGGGDFPTGGGDVESVAVGSRHYVLLGTSSYVGPIFSAQTGKLKAALWYCEGVQSESECPAHVVGDISSDGNFAIDGIGSTFNFTDLRMVEDPEQDPTTQPLQFWFAGSRIRAVAFAPTTANWAVATERGDIYLGRGQRPIGGCDVDTRVCAVAAQVGGSPRAVAFTADGAAAVVGGTNGLLDVVDFGTKEVSSITLPNPADSVTGVAVDPSGKYLAVSSNSSETDTSLPGTLTVFDLSSGTPTVFFSVPVHSRAVTSVDVSSDGKYLLTGGSDGTAIAWVYRTGTLAQVAVFDATKAEGGAGCSVTGVRFLADGQRVVAGCSGSAASGLAVVWQFRG